MENDRPKSSALTITVIGVVVLILCYLLRNVLLPFVIAAALAYIAAPLLRWMRSRLGMPRWAAAITLYIAFLLLLAGVGVWVYFYLIPQLAALARSAPHLLHRALTELFGPDDIHLLGRTLSAADVSRKLSEQLSGFVADAGAMIRTTTIGFEIIMGAVLTLVLVFYFLLHGRRLRLGLLWLFPPGRRLYVSQLAMRVDPMLSRYIRGLLIVVLYTAVVTWLVTGWLFHLEHALLLAIAVGVLELIPVIGPILSIMLIGVIAAEQVSFWMIMGFSIFAIALRLSIDQIVGPLILGRAVLLHPVAIIFAFLAGGLLFGVLGVLIAIPVAATLKIALAMHYSEERAMGRH